MVKKHALILGAGFAGLELAAQLSESLRDEVRVTLLDQSDSFSFGFSKLDVMFGRRAAEDHPGAELGKQPDVGTRDARIKNVAENRHVQSGNAPLLLANRECIQQRLRRVFVRTVSGVDDGGPDQARDLMRRA